MTHVISIIYHIILFSNKSICVFGWDAFQSCREEIMVVPLSGAIFMYKGKLMKYYVTLLGEN